MANDDFRVDKKVGDRGDGSSVYERVNDDGTVTFIEQRDPLINNLRQRIEGTDWREMAKRGLETLTAGLKATAGPMGFGAAGMANDALNSRFANRDVQPKVAPEEQPQEQTPPTGGPDMPTQAPTPQAQAPQVQMRPSGGGGGGGPVTRDDAMAAAGNVGIVPEMRDARDRAAGHAQAGVDTYNNLQQSMQSTMMAGLEARRNVAMQQESDAREMRDFLGRRMADEEEMRQQLRASANIKMPESLGDRPFALVGMAIAGLGGNGGDKFIADQVNKEIERDINVQVKQFENNLGMSREQRAQWDQRMATLGDIHKARASAKIQAVEAARDFFAGSLELAKTEDSKMRLLQVVDKLDMQIAEKQQDMAVDTEKEFWKLKEARRREAAAAANRAAALEREERHRTEDFDRKRELLQMSLDSREDIAGKRSGGAASNPDKQAQNINKEMGKSASLEAAADHVDGMLDSGRSIGTVRSMASQYAPAAVAELGASEEEKELIRGIRDEARQLLMMTGGKNITMNEKAIAEKAMQGGGLSFADMKNIHNVAKRELHKRRQAAESLGSPVSQEAARKWRESAGGR